MQLKEVSCDMFIMAMRRPLQRDSGILKQNSRFKFYRFAKNSFLKPAILFFTVILFGLATCQSEDEITLERCDRTNLNQVEKLYNATGIIKKSEITGLYHIYEIEVGAFGKGLPLNPCNLPLEFRIQDLKISFSGQLLEPDDWDFSDYAAHPIELTEIDLIESRN